MKRSVCLNADIGELPGKAGRALDRAILDVISRCSIACGGHAGDEDSIRATLEAAKARKVVIGVHPSYPDRKNFGRASLDISKGDLLDALRTQVRSFLSIANELGVDVAHMKPHGALYNEAAQDETLASMLVKLAEEIGIPVLVGLPDTEVSRAAGKSNLAFIAEGFADRRYQEDGRLVPRNLPGAVITDKAAQIDQIIGLVENGSLISNTGYAVHLNVQTICIHGDTQGAVESAAALRDALAQHNIEIRAAAP